jgi:hypothetical protein
MSRIRLILLSVVALCAVSASASASASAATCYQVAKAGTGNLDNSCVTNEGPTKNNYIAVTKLENKLKKGEWCAKVEVAKTGNYKNAACTEKVAEQEFIKVLVPEYQFYTCKKLGAGNKFPSQEACEKSGSESGGEWEWSPIAAGEEFAVEGMSGVSILEAEIAGLKTEILCEIDKVTGALEAEGKNKGEITFEGCALYEVKNSNHELHEICTVEVEKFTFTSQLVRGEALGPEHWGPEVEFNGTLENGVFVNIKLGEACGLLKGTYPAKQHEVDVIEGGTSVNYTGQVCSLPQAADADLAPHLIVCTSKGSHLTFANKPAYFFSTDEIESTTKLAFYAE